jgi:redox-sensitive bicupin YhaK (pirin superfamily)
MKHLHQLLSKPRPHWVGDGFHVYPVFDEFAFTLAISPFLMFDYGAPKYFPPTTKKLGVGQHPHRGFETVTIAFQGEVEHRDCNGGHGIIGPGDVQWMTAASGVVHEEFHSRKFAETGGTMEMAQLWVNLPALHKMDPPKYQAILSTQISEVPIKNDSGLVRIIAGEYNGIRGPAQTVTPINVWDVTIHQGQRVSFSVADGFNVILFVRSGTVTCLLNEDSTTVLSEMQVAILSTEGNQFDIQENSMNASAKLLILSGEPINEPIAARGPFVMNTNEELTQAMIDYRNGKLGGSLSL